MTPVLVLLFLLGALPAQAQKEPAREVWESVSRERQEHILENYRRYQGMPPERREWIKKRFELFRRFPREKRIELIRGWKAFRSLSPEKQRDLRERWRHLDAHKRAKLKQVGRPARGRRSGSERAAPRNGERGIHFERMNRGHSRDHGGHNRRR